MSPDDLIRLRHMADAAALAMEFARGRERAELDRDAMLRLALTRAVEIVGEAASKVSAEARQGLEKVAWAAIVGMRNRLVHAYFDVDVDQLWMVVIRDLPELLKQLQPFIEKPEEGAG